LKSEQVIKSASDRIYTSLKDQAEKRQLPLGRIVACKTCKVGIPVGGLSKVTCWNCGGLVVVKPMKEIRANA
jgi:hypothetical protein